MFENEMYIPVINRIYYSIQALLIISESNFSKHGQVKGFLIVNL